MSEVNQPLQPQDKTHLLQFDFSMKAYAKLLAIRERSGARTFADVVKNSLGFYQVYLEAHERGGRVLIEDVDGELREIEPPQGFEDK